jgi:hypothetical protein
LGVRLNQVGGVDVGLPGALGRVAVGDPLDVVVADLLAAATRADSSAVQYATSAAAVSARWMLAIAVSSIQYARSAEPGR